MSAIAPVAQIFQGLNEKQILTVQADGNKRCLSTLCFSLSVSHMDEEQEIKKKKDPKGTRKIVTSVGDWNFRRL